MFGKDPILMFCLLNVVSKLASVAVSWLSSVNSAHASTSSSSHVYVPAMCNSLRGVVFVPYT